MALKMKKLSIIVAVAFLFALALSSCNRELCPAYGSTDKETPENIG